MFEAWRRWQQGRDELALEYSSEVARILQRDQQKQQAHQRPIEQPKVTGPRFYHYRRHGVETIATDQTGPRMIRGVVSTPTINTNKRSLKSSGCQARFPIPLKCDHHKLGQIGDVTLVTIEPTQVIIHALLWNTDAATYAWENLIRTGEMRCLSAGAVSIRKTIVDGITFAERWLLDEVSIVRVPANPDCTFEVMP
jgi:hypothetical protein